jgi:phosphate transport system protein
MEEKNQIDTLKSLTLDMMSQVKENIKNGVDALSNRDETLAQMVIESDKKVDSIELEIEDSCIKLLRSIEEEKDIRLVSGVWKIITDIERIGDYATHIAEVAKILSNKPLIKPLIDIPAMAENVIDMISICEDSFKSSDVSYLNPIWEIDLKVDALYEQVFRELISYILETPRLITNAIYLTQVARFFERAGDHATNIGERIFYIITGKKIKRGKIDANV